MLSVITIQDSIRILVIQVTLVRIAVEVPEQVSVSILVLYVVGE